jgi:hypothetical protein
MEFERDVPSLRLSGGFSAGALNLGKDAGLLEHSLVVILAAGPRKVIIP